ncbi:MAG: hypothetical protein A2600_09895 [Candidatus Lambdaproteobacteria bacterium RIFOXYD1_FULL_56_27]|uniref:Conjugal transfer protein TraF n=1 Tax=Candidatus Lambdaproteobacteria bacterium RIFOXYD2_FULL_56_26 TaxID=1817773 RepID=A0A1F6GUK9_9PROT|nr:MAG: hypothetical protein A2557_11795 [Candidatus Lambdaproteobacteria bacterium RIFOXYD2_FULL_56_26]OGH04329.1 MAG: hypothetical protein A2426_05750 [Candidatus Lambdaproteobacteria bacterium RIFOXYC1_FULL_56_13]OGH07391.1 MAG: hypothetical protein A2600_09895 [Candidatus Lambdaproteobacteria bacterium RIFOXYD1_FULL_56_27]
MRSFRFQRVWLCLGLGLCLVPAGWAKEEKVGWWNYNWTAPKKEEPQEEAKAAAPSPSAPAAQSPTAPARLSEKELWQMHPDQFQEHLKTVHKWAVKTLDPADVQHYREVQDIARRKASAYAAVSGYLAERDPMVLRSDLDVPVTNPGRVAVKQRNDMEVDEFLRAKSKRYGLIYFKSETCSLCKAQNGIMSYLAHDLPGLAQENVDVDLHPDLAGRFNVRSTPTLLLLEDGNPNPELIAVGVVALNVLKERLWRRIRVREGLSQPQQYYTYEAEQGGPQDPLAGGTP